MAHIRARSQASYCEVIDVNVHMKNIRVKPLIVAIAIPLAVGGLSSLLTRGSMEAFGRLNQPPLTPPDWVFPVVWSILYVLMGIASYLVFMADASRRQKRDALLVYGATLILNFVWPLLFFRFGLFLAAFVWLLCMIAVVGLLYIRFRRIHKNAGYCILPYFLWSAFAGYLNFGVYWLNR